MYIDLHQSKLTQYWIHPDLKIQINSAEAASTTYRFIFITFFVTVVAFCKFSVVLSSFGRVSQQKTKLYLGKSIMTFVLKSRLVKSILNIPHGFDCLVNIHDIFLKFTSFWPGQVFYGCEEQYLVNYGNE